MSTRWMPNPDARGGARAMVPVLVGILPAGVAIGAASASTGIPAGAALLAAGTVYGASAQLTVVELTARGAPVAVVALAVAVVSARLVLLGMALGRRLCGEGAATRWLAALVLVDPAYLVADTRFTRDGTRREHRDFYLGAALTLWVGWQLANACGVVLGSVVPSGLALEFTLPLALVALIAPRLRDRRARAATVVSAVVATVTAGAPWSSGLIVAIVAGVVAAGAVDRPRARAS